MRVAITALSFAALACVFCCQMRAQSPRVEQRSKRRLRLPVRSRRKRGITGLTGTAIASVIGSLSSVPMSAGTIGFRARRPRTDRARLMGARFKFGFARAELMARQLLVPP
jgi:hypothetical protein